ncbi:hypothetical protein [Nocardia sp. NPDC051570]|uniref:hypothetical protein n=1 Tax=Nocardia sp. NPDC051570 TaxID=3364324 RepID=UPI0037953A9A
MWYLAVGVAFAITFAIQLILEWAKKRLDRGGLLIGLGFALASLVAWPVAIIAAIGAHIWEIRTARR